MFVVFYEFALQWLAYHHSDRIEKIETVRAFHFGTSFLVEVHIVLPETMLVKDAHDIAEGLQQKIERLPEVERVCTLSILCVNVEIHFPSRHSFTSIMNVDINQPMNIK